MATGPVNFFNSQKGFGFITPSDGSKDVFVHISAVERAGMSTLNEGQRVNYEVLTERGTLAAGNLSNAERAPQGVLVRDRSPAAMPGFILLACRPRRLRGRAALRA